jgi:hypothetical protein
VCSCMTAWSTTVAVQEMTIITEQSVNSKFFTVCFVFPVRATLSGNVLEAMGSGNELRLTNLAISDTGLYSCTAINSKGAANGHSYVRVTGKLQHGENASVKLCWKNQSKHLSCRFSA